MVRYAIIFMMLATMAVVSGCAMCASPYDYCGPTFTMEPGQSCNPLARANSRLSPPLETVYLETVYTASVEPTPAPRPQSAPSTAPLPAPAEQLLD